MIFKLLRASSGQPWSSHRACPRLVRNLLLVLSSFKFHLGYFNYDHKNPLFSPISLQDHKTHSSFQIEKDSSASHSFQEPSSPKMFKSPSLQRASGLHVVRPADVAFHSQESPRICSPPVEDMIENGVCMDATHKEPTIKRQDSFEMRLPELPKIDVHSVHKKTSASDPESPVSPLLTSDPKNERSHSQTFSRPPSQFDDVPLTLKKSKGAQFQKEPSFWRLVKLSLAEWLYAVLGSTGAAIFGSFNPVLAYVIALTVTVYYRTD